MGHTRGAVLPAPEPFFLDGSTGSLFCVHFPVAAATGRSVLVLPPFAEELNKCRRMMALTAYALQRAGLDVLIVDLFGTGDSAGDFADASLEVWRSDVTRAARWLLERGSSRLNLLAVRAGALLFQDFGAGLDLPVGRVVLWQPVTSGRLVVSQFLRLRLAENLWVDSGEERTVEPRAALASDGRVEVSGYEISQALVAQLEGVEDPLTGTSGWHDLTWLEVVADPAVPLAPASRRALEAIRTRGVNANFLTVAGEPFWATPEIAVVPGLIDATVTALSGGAG